MRDRMITTISACVLVALVAATARGQDQEEAARTAVRERGQQAMQAFNAGQAEEFAAAFLPGGELIDEQGGVYRGREKIAALVAAFAEQFPGAKVEFNAETIRLIGPVAIDEGNLTMTTADGQTRSHFRYIAVWAKSDDGWKLASFRDFADEPPRTARDNLEAIAWLEGEWVNEGADGKVKINYHWSEDGNFLIGEFTFDAAVGLPRKSTQRIGWDAAQGKIRSWLFDSDGGFAEGTWTIVEDGVVIKSASVNPDGASATATLNIYVDDDDRDHYRIEGTDRVVGNVLEPDFEIKVVREPPAAGN